MHALIFLLLMQSGSNDCGLFAVAFATAIAFGEDPTNIFFDQETMRGHLFKCYNNGFLSPFPVRRNRVPTEATREIIDIYCNCRMPELKNVDMIECVMCKNRFHNVCVNIDIPQDSDLWYCLSCKV